VARSAWERTVPEVLPQRAGAAGETVRYKAESRNESIQTMFAGEVYGLQTATLYSSLFDSFRSIFARGCSRWTIHSNRCSVAATVSDSRTSCQVFSPGLTATH